MDYRPRDSEEEEAQDQEAAEDGDSTPTARPLLPRPLLSLWSQGTAFSVLFFAVTVALNCFDGFLCTNKDFCIPNRSVNRTGSIMRTHRVELVCLGRAGTQFFATAPPTTSSLLCLPCVCWCSSYPCRGW